MVYIHIICAPAGALDVSPMVALPLIALLALLLPHACATWTQGSSYANLPDDRPRGLGVSPIEIPY